jgi:hypothetical protein
LACVCVTGCKECDGCMECENGTRPVCPICGKYSDNFYLTNDGEVLGCENCIKVIDCWEAIGKIE